MTKIIRSIVFRYGALGLLIGVLCIGSLVRVYRLAEVPAGFFADEASVGFDAYQILTTGRDSYGIPFPIFFQSLGDFKAPIPIYSIIPFFAVFGTNETAVRMTSVFYGIVTLVSLYFLGRIWHSQSVGIWAAFAGATMPWLIHYDRVAFLMNIYAAFFTFSLLLFFIALQKKRVLILSFTSFALTLYTYQPPKLIVPLTLFGLCILYRKTISQYKKESILAVFCFFLISIPLLMSIVSGEGVKRFHQVSIFKGNKPLEQALLQSTRQYFLQLSPVYLIVKGDNSFNLRHFANGLTPLLPVTYVFLILGIAICIYHRKEKKYQAILFLLLVYPIAGALVDDPPFSSRSVIGAPLFALFIAVGVTSYITLMQRITKNHLAKTGFVVLLVVLFLLNFLTFTRFYFSVYPRYSSGYWGWQYGYRPMISYLKMHESSYDELIITHRFNAGEWMFRFYNIEFQCQKCSILPNPINIDHSRRQLFALRFEDIQEAKKLYPTYTFQIRKTIYSPGNEAQVHIGTFSSPLASAGKMY